MEETGISIQEACARNVIGTQEDFERSCNPDGTVKQVEESTTFTINGNDSTFTVNNDMIVGSAVLGLLLLVAAATIVLKKRKQTHKKSSSKKR